MNLIKRFFLSFCIIFSSIWILSAWNWLVAEDGDILSYIKWNELLTYVDWKIQATNILAGNNISVSVNGNDVTIDAIWWWSGTVPYISGGPEVIQPNITKNIIINGSYFSPSTVFSIPSFTGIINSQTAISPTEFLLNITAPASNGDFDLVASNSGVDNTQWSGNGVNYISILSIAGNGPAGTYTENFEAGIWNWTNTWWMVAWSRDNGGTPSNGTGPNTGAGWSNWYIFTEASNPNNPNVNFGIETDYFNIVQSVSFDYHMIGGNMWTLQLQTLQGTTWTTRWSITGSQQAGQWDAYINQNVNLSTFPVESIRFLGTSGNGWSSDIALDNISIVSN